MKRRVFSLLVALAMVLATVPVQAAGGSFTLAVVTQDQVVVEPEAVPIPPVKPWARHCWPRITPLPAWSRDLSRRWTG